MTVGMIYPSGYPVASGTCQRCGRHMERIEAALDGIPYCHPHRGPDCYRIASNRVAIEQYSFPQRFMTGAPPVIPMHETPIYAELKAEYAELKYGTAWVEVIPDLSKFREQEIEHMMRPFAASAATAFERAMLDLWALGSAPVKEFRQYPAAVHELSRNTGWSLEESADMYQRVAKWSADAITKENIDALNRSRMSKPNHYPTSTPPWARRKR